MTGMADEEREGQPGERQEQEAPPSLEQLLEEASREREQFRALAQRVQADFINYKRRVEEDREELQKEANARLILHLLPVMDDFQRALEHSHSPEEHSAWLEGIELIQKKLQAVLELAGVTPIEAVGQTFDPWEHEALLHQETADHQEGRVIGVIQQGYKLYGKVLRPAQVVVAKRAGGTQAPTGTNSETSSEEKE